MVIGDFDLAIVGGGLAGGLVALALARSRPDLRLLLLEQDARFGGNHIWSCFASDIADDDAWLVEPLIAARWDGYDVRFAGHPPRTLDTRYRSLTSDRLDAALRAALPADSLRAGVQVAAIGQRHVLLADGRRLAGGGVIDARGPTAMPRLAGGWQKFLGRTLRLGAPHGLTRPIVMDATVVQHDGYRFVYVLPFSPTELFVEDTYYSDSPVLAPTLLRERIADYAAAQGWRIAAVTHEETGVLPVIAAGDFAAFWPETADAAASDAPARAGIRAALVHPLTSYSLPNAVRFARMIAAQPDLSGATLARVTRAHAARHWRDAGFYRLLARMLFGAAAPEARARVLARFYTLSAPLIERFYAGRSTRADMVRVLAGRPPVPVLAAIASLSGHGRPLAALGAIR